MKKLLFFLALAGSFLIAQPARAQSAISVVGTNDTLVNTDAETFTVRMAKVYPTVAIQAVVTKVSGTVAGYAISQVSVDGTNYVDLDTLTLTNVASQTKIWTYSNSPYLYHRVRFTSSGTTVYLPAVYIVTR